jgi:hypothetical protein
VVRWTRVEDGALGQHRGRSDDAHDAVRRREDHDRLEGVEAFYADATRDRGHQDPGDGQDKDGVHRFRGHLYVPHDRDAGKRVGVAQRGFTSPAPPIGRSTASSRPSTSGIGTGRVVSGLKAVRNR